MVRGALVALVAGLLLVLGTTATASADDEPPVDTPDPVAGPLRVMVVGDSMTQGRTGSATWRYWLWRELRRQQVPAEMVGPTTDIARGHTYERLDRGFDLQRAHAARGGTGFAYHLARVTDVMSTYLPDVVVLQLGYNDAPRHTAREIVQDTITYVKRARAVLPDVVFVVGEIPPRAVAAAGLEPERGAAALARRKNAITGRANQLLAPRLDAIPGVWRSHLRTDPMLPWAPRTMTYDGVHPDATGETLMAQRHAEALVAAGILPGPVELFRIRAWAPPVAPDQLSVIDDHLALRWARTFRELAATQVLAQVRDERRGTTFLLPGSDTGMQVVLAPGSYEVRLIAVRGSMRSRPGSPVIVKVRRP